MGLTQLFGKEAVVGIDIGSSTIKALEVEQKGNTLRVLNAAVEPMPPGSCRDGVITNVEEVARTVKSVLRAAGARGAQAVTAISGSQVIVRQVQFPKMTEAALRKSIKYEASKFVSAPMEESVVEFEILGDADDAGQMNVMLVAAPKDMVESRVSVLEQAGVEPVAVDVESFALLRSLVSLRPYASGIEGTLALVNLGATHTDVNIACQGEFALTRNVPIAGESITNSIRSVFNISQEEAEQMKREMAIPTDLARDAGSADSRVWRAAQPVIEDLLREIRRSINFHQQQFPENSESAQIGKVLLCGGTALIAGIGEYFTAKLGIPTEVVDVFADSVLSTGELMPEFVPKYSPVLAVVVGLAVKDEPVAKLAMAA